MKTVRSRGNPLFRTFVKLKGSPRERRRAGNTLLEGPHLVASYMERKGAPVAIAVSEEALAVPEIRQLLDSQRPERPEPLVLPDALFREISSVTTPSGIVAIVPIPAARPIPHDVACCVLLEGVQDPGNLGSILRSAAAAGVRHVLLSRGCADPWSPRVLRGAMGAHELLAIEDRADLDAYARAYHGQVVAAAANRGRALYDIDLLPPTAFVFGNEGAGVSRGLLETADVTASVPMAAGVESISVGAAAAVCLFERVRQLEGKHRGR